MIMNAICPLSQIPVRSEPSDRSEMVTQILFGETFSILEERGNWVLIHIHLDDYEGWIDRKQALIIDNEYPEQVNPKSKHVLADKTGICKCKNDGTQILLSKGCNLPSEGNGIFRVAHKTFVTSSKIKAIPKKFHASKVVAQAMDYLNVPYLWGGRSIMGVDCSGLVQVVYHMCGFNLPRDASQQAIKGTAIDFIDEALPGDLAFFDNPSGEIIHVGIMMSPDKILHASGCVKIERIDHNGIFNAELGTYSHSLRIIKRL